MLSAPFNTAATHQSGNWGLGCALWHKMQNDWELVGVDMLPRCRGQSAGCMYRLPALDLYMVPSTEVLKYIVYAQQQFS